MLNAVKYFCKKAPLKIFEFDLHTTLIWQLECSEKHQNSSVMKMVMMMMMMIMINDDDDDDDDGAE